MKMDDQLDKMRAGFSWLEVRDWWRVVMNNNACERCRSQDISRRFTKRYDMVYTNPFAGSSCHTSFHFLEPIHVFYIGTNMYGQGMQTGWPRVRSSIAAGCSETFQTGPEAHPVIFKMGIVCLSQG